MKTFFLIVYLLTPEGWRMGDNIDGWAPRQQPSMEVCLERKAYAEQQPLPDGILEMHWVCRERTDIDPGESKS